MVEKGVRYGNLKYCICGGCEKSCIEFFIFRWGFLICHQELLFQDRLWSSFNQLTTNVSHHVEISQLIVFTSIVHRGGLYPPRNLNFQNKTKVSASDRS